MLDDFWPFQTILTILTAYGFTFLLRRVVSAWKRYRERVFAVKDIIYEKPHWLFGHLLDVQPNEESFKRKVKLMEKYPKCRVTWLGPFAVFIDGYYPDFMQTVMSTDEPKDEVGYRMLRPWIGDGLLTSSGKKWKRNRRLLTPAFHFDALRRYLDCMNASTTELITKWQRRTTGENELIKVEMFHDISQMTLDNLLRCIISKESGCQKDDRHGYLQAVRCLSEIAIRRFFNPLYHYDFIFYLTPMGRKYKKALKIAHDFTGSAIKQRQANMIDSTGDDRSGKMDFLDILLQARDDQGRGLTLQEIRDEVDTFVFEGHDTVSSGISWAMYNLAVHPDLQEKCRNEINDVLGGRQIIEWEDLGRFTYLTMFIKESMRLYPPVFSIGRTLTKPMHFKRGFGKDLFNCSQELPEGDAGHFSKVFPKDTALTMGIRSMHYNPNVWNEPHTFDPERFTAENISKRSTHAYVPFSAGPRNCIGQHFAMNEMKVVLARTLSVFRLSLDESHPHPEAEPHLILRAKNGIHVVLQQL